MWRSTLIHLNQVILASAHYQVDSLNFNFLALRTVNGKPACTNNREIEFEVLRRAVSLARSDRLKSAFLDEIRGSKKYFLIGNSRSFNF